VIITAQRHLPFHITFTSDDFTVTNLASALQAVNHRGRPGGQRAGGAGCRARPARGPRPRRRAPAPGSRDQPAWRPCRLPRSRARSARARRGEVDGAHTRPLVGSTESYTSTPLMFTVVTSEPSLRIDIETNAPPAPAHPPCYVYHALNFSLRGCQWPRSLPS
jgi:hypothetical protein